MAFWETVSVLGIFSQSHGVVIFIDICRCYALELICRYCCVVQSDCVHVYACFFNDIGGINMMTMLFGTVMCLYVALCNVL